MRPFFIVGCPRSGTTLLQQLLVAHKEVVIPPETAFFTKVVPRSGRVNRRALNRLNRDLQINLELEGRLSDQGVRDAYEAVSDQYSAQLGSPDATWFGEKTPDHLRHAERVAALFPEARFVLIHRDGRDVALSLSRVPWSPSDPLVNFAIWRQAAHFQERWLAAPSAPTVVVRYEDLAREPEVAVRRVTDFLEIPYQSELVTQKRAPQGIPDWEMGWKSRATEAVNTDRIEVWRRELPAEVVDNMERLGGRELSQLGYSLSAPPGRTLTPLALASLNIRWAVWRASALLRQLARRA